MAAKPNFERFLVENQVLTDDVVKRAQADALVRKTTLFQCLVESGSLSEEDLARNLARFHQVEYQPGPIHADPALVSQFPAFTLRRYRILPLQRTDTQLTIVTANPGNFLATDEMRRVTKLPVKVLCTTESAINEALSSLGPVEPSAASKVVKAGNPEPAEGAPAPLRIATQAPAAKPEELTGAAAKIDNLLQRCITKGASDIHLEPGAQVGAVRERIDGILYEVERVSNDLFQQVLSRIKLLGGMDIVEKRLAQDGRFRFQAGKVASEIRCSTLPTIHGEKMVMRILRSEQADPSLEMLDVGMHRLDLIRRISELPDGLVLVAGPTGSGKTTTIYAILSALDRKSQNLIMVEDPVEYEMAGTTQVQVNTKIGVTFASILPAILRQDPDILMVGEVREEETAQMVMRAAVSGHLVFSTIHAPTALETVTRLMDMGVQSHMVAASLKACISQRLLRKLCHRCRKPREATEADRRILGVQDERLTLYDPEGCGDCHHIGYSGRFAAMEILAVEDELCAAIVKRDKPLFEELARKRGFKTMRDHAVERVIAGDTTIKEMVANCPEN